MVCLREDPISLPFTFSDAAQSALFLPNLLHLPAQLLLGCLQGQEPSPLASGRGPWHPLNSGTWRAAGTLCGSLCPSRDSCFCTFWGNCPLTTMSKTVTAPLFQGRPLTSLLLHTLLHKLMALLAVRVGPSQTPVKELFTLPNQRELCQRLQASWVACKLPRNKKWDEIGI